MGRCKVAIVIPAFNEEATIFEVVSSVNNYGQVIVVDDASTDGTRRVKDTLGTVLVRHSENRGYDAALNSGFKKAEELGFEFVITFDADGQHAPTMIDKYIEILNNQADLVLGVRPKFARISERLFKIYADYRFGVKDPLCGMKGYRMDLYKELGHFDSCGSIGTELALHSIVNNCRVCQIEVSIAERNDSPRFGSIFLSNLNILKALLRVMKLYGSK